MSTATQTELPQELVNQVIQLTPALQDQLIDLIYDSREPEAEEQWKEWNKRIDEMKNGTVKGMTLEESKMAILTALREKGIEL